MKRLRGTFLLVVLSAGGIALLLRTFRRTKESGQAAYLLRHAGHLPLFAEEAGCLDPQKDQVGVHNRARRYHLE